ncbi:MAG: hypothetical protein ACN6OC_00670, partial [Alcaligenes sp.]
MNQGQFLVLRRIPGTELPSRCRTGFLKTPFKAQEDRTALMACRRGAPVPWSGRLAGRVVNSGGLL